MSSLNRRRDDVAKTQNVCADLFLFNRKVQIKKKIQILLRDKIVNMIESNLQLSLLRRVIVLLSTLIVKKAMNERFRKMNKNLKALSKTSTKRQQRLNHTLRRRRRAANSKKTQRRSSSRSLSI
jgi:hypothetical protein